MLLGKAENSCHLRVRLLSSGYKAKASSENKGLIFDCLICLFVDYILDVFKSDTVTNDYIYTDERSMANNLVIEK